MKTKLSRRSALQTLTGGAAVLAAASSLSHRLSAAETAGGAKLKGRINHSVCKWCYGSIPLDEFCQAAKAMGLQSVELLGVNDFPTLKKHGLTCAVVSGVPGGIENGLNRLENHDKIVEFMERTLPAAADFGAPTVICFSGNRRGMSDEQGLENCAIGLKRIAPIAERHKVTVIMELLNSKVNHKDYMADSTAWALELVKRLGSERFKLLYDIYHMQIMEGDIIRTINEYKDYIGHYHTGGNPGRNEIDETQEIYYPAVARAIAETGFSGYFAHEFVPKRDPLTSLAEAVKICTV